MDIKHHSTMRMTYVSMYDGRFPGMQVFKATCDIQHETKYALERRTRNVSLQPDQQPLHVPLYPAHNIVKEITVLAKLAHEHARDL